MKTILVVDDSNLTRQCIRKELQAGSYHVLEASSGREAIGAVIVQPPDLITLDLDMPEMNGYQTLEKLRDTWDKMVTDKVFPPVVIVTGRDTVEEREKGFNHGASNFLTKPFKEGALISVIRQIENPNHKYVGMKVLVADDSTLVRKVVANTLKEAGIQSIWECRDGTEALEVLRQNPHDVDLVITDYMMPEMNGDLLCAKARTELGLKNVPFIFMSQLPERTSILEIFKAGATDYVVKPFVKEELIARVIAHFETRLLNKSLEEKVGELTELNRIKDDLISITSHDLRSPLSGILGLAEITLMEEGLTEETLENLGMIKDAGQFLLDMVNDILDLSAIQAGSQKLPLSKIEAVEIGRSALQTFRQQAHSKKVLLEIETGGREELYVCGNRSALTRIINNLISNAVKFSQSDGKVTLRMAESDQRARISVTDTGIGIPEDLLPKLFDRFSKTSRPGTAREPGTGLGLCITRELVEKQGGKLEVESVVGKGTRIQLDLPVSSQN